MSEDIDIISECIVPPDDGLTFGFDDDEDEDGFEDRVELGNEFPWTCTQGMISFEGESYSNEDKLVEDLLVMARLGIKGNVEGINKWHEVTNYVLSDSKVSIFRSTGRTYNTTPDSVEE